DVARGLGKFIYDVGTKAQFDYGAYFFQETLSHALTYAVEKPVALPTLLCNIILEQHPDILRSTDVPCKRKGVLVIEQRLLDGTNVAAGVGTSVQAGVLSRKQMIADLTEASRALEARKQKIDRVIEALKAEEAAETAEGEPDGQ
ncbi:envelope-like protein, partial [Trifolium pratense]